MGIPEILTTFWIGISQKIKHFFGCKGKEDMGISKNIQTFFLQKMEFPIFYYFWH